jgi:hypothetical protein
MSEEVTEYYEKIRSESKEVLAGALPTIVLDVAAVILVWLFGRLVFIPVAEGINFYGYPLPQILNFVILVALAVILLRIIRDVRKAIGGLAGMAACEIGAPNEATSEEVEHYKTALGGIFNIVVVSLAYLLFVDYFSDIHPGLAGVTLVLIVVWAIYQIWRIVQAVSIEIQKYTTQWTKKTLS